MPKPLLRTTLISALGGVFEFYDFVLFAVFAPQIGATFFPAEAGPTAQTLRAFAVFAVGYFARPFGGILWAHVADRRGRAYVFSHTVLGMAASTLLIALLPGHATLGAAAPWLLVLLRLLQGMALGGEIPASLCWLVEHAGERRAALAAATLMAGVNSGMLLGQTVAAALTAWLGADAVAAWGWRLAFAFGSVVGVTAWFVRRHVGETTAFAELQRRGAIERLPARALLQRTPGAVLRAAALCAVHAWVVAALYLALPSFLVAACAMPLTAAEAVALASASAGSLLYVLAGWLGDRGSPTRVARAALVLLLALAVPCYALAPSLGWWPLALLGGVGGVFIGAYLALLPGLFAASVRTSGLALGYDGAFALVGGAGPVTMLWLADRVGPAAVGALTAVFAALALLALRRAPTAAS
jgi:MFS family permease